MHERAGAPSPRRRFTAVASVAAATIGLSLVTGACAGKTPPPSSAPSAAACGARVVPPRGVNAPLLPSSACSLPDFDSTRFRTLLGQLRGAPVVVNVWGSWCGPCIKEAPELARLAREFAGRAQFVGVDINDLRAPAQNFIRRFDWPYPSVFDSSGAIYTDLGLVGQPNTVVFSRTGERTFTWAGAVDAGRLRQAIERALGARS
ncbi:MAG TPA: TlpA disulfide reductase family protein [Actinomycetota bacterium]